MQHRFTTQETTPHQHLPLLNPPLTQVSPQDADTSRQCLKLLEALEELDDVNSISTNLEIDDALFS